MWSMNNITPNPILPLLNQQLTTMLLTDWTQGIHSYFGSLDNFLVLTELIHASVCNILQLVSCLPNEEEV